MTKLFVGNFPFETTEESLRGLFSRHGVVQSAKLIVDRDSGRPRGFAFVEMSNSDASRAIQALNGSDYEGRPLRVNEAQEKDRSYRGTAGRR